ncbi:MAG: DsrE family protein, partial [Candidatus Heimdallarchaeota archaeon]|nr:DsrE family protein [Candidatus Heimdallarchaeota archaeon]
ACGSCLSARGLKEVELIEGVEFSTMSHLTQWTVDADKVITF